MREGEIKNLKMKIKQLEIQLSNTKQEKDDRFKTMRKVIDCKDTELQFQVILKMVTIIDKWIIIIVFNRNKN